MEPIMEPLTSCSKNAVAMQVLSGRLAAAAAGGHIRRDDDLARTVLAPLGDVDRRRRLSLVIERDRTDDTVELELSERIADCSAVGGGAGGLHRLDRGEHGVIGLGGEAVRLFVELGLVG